MATDWIECKNNAETTLDGAINDVVMALSVTDGTQMPTDLPFRITIDNEIIEVQSIDGVDPNLYDVVDRGMEGTTPAVHTNGADVFLNVVAGIIQQIQSAVGTVENLVDGMSRKNAIINGCFRVAQRGTSFTSATTPANSDDTYLLDRWILLSDGNDVVDVSQVIRTTPNGSYAECKLEVETPNKQFGKLTILEAKDAARYIGQTVSVQVKARMAAADDNTHSIKIVVLSWDGAADVVTSDVVDAWGASPTYVANWTAENTPASQTLTTTEQTFKVEGIAIDTASTKNIAVFIFCDQTDGVVDDAIIITDVQLELGSVVTPFEFRPLALETKLCQWRCIKISSLGANYAGLLPGFCYTTSATYFILTFPTMAAAPTVTYSGQTDFAIFYTGGFAVTTTITAMAVGSNSVSIAPSVAGTPFTAGQGANLVGNGTAVAFILLTTEL